MKVDTKLQKDIREAQKIVCNAKLKKEKKSYHELSTIYRTTNECICARPYFESLKNREKVLSVIASGDQIINSILLGTKDITGYDISTFPKYYLMLKLAAIKTLSKEEYLEFIIGSEQLKYSTYEKVRKELDEDYLKFWDSLFDYFDECEINESSIFSTEITDKGLFTFRNPYLRGNNYETTKEKIKNVNIELLEGNIFKLVKQNIGTFDLINLSNIINYLNENFNCNNREALIKYRDFLKSLPLNNNGVALSYIFGFESRWKKQEGVYDIFKDKEFEIYPLGYDVIGDGILIYQKKK